MKASQLLISAQKISRSSIRGARFCVFGASNTQNRTYHRSVLNETSSTSQTTTSCLKRRTPQAGLNIEKYLYKGTVNVHTSSSLSRRFSSTSTIMSTEPTIHNIYEPVTGTWQYLVADPSSRQAVIIDSVLDYDPATQTISTQTADSLLSMVSQHGYQISRILETHAHADHLTAATYLQLQLKKKQGFKPPICIGRRITQVQEVFGKRYGIPQGEYKGPFDKLLEDDEVFKIGDLAAKVIHLPGHTPDHIGYIIGDNVFCGDSIFHPDIGTARCDFPGGSATSLYHSAQKLLQLPEHVKIWTGHDYVSEERNTPVPCMSVQEHKERNMYIREGVTQEEFVVRRQERDKALKAPKLLHPSLQVNIRAGRLPALTELGQRLLHLPLQVDGEAW